MVKAYSRASSLRLSASNCVKGGAVALWQSVELRSERSGVLSSLRSPCCILEQDTFTSQKVLVIPRKQWLRPDMTEKLLTGT